MSENTNATKPRDKASALSTGSIWDLDLQCKQSIVDLLMDVQSGKVSCRRAATEIQKSSEQRGKLQPLVRQFEVERAAEGDRFQKQQGCLRISALNPRRTQETADWRHEQLMKHVRNWTQNWWVKHGYKIEFEDDESTAGELVLSVKRGPQERSELK